jgi:hypothetical protein
MYVNRAEFRPLFPTMCTSSNGKVERDEISSQKYNEVINRPVKFPSHTLESH